MSKVVTFGEIMLRLAPNGYYRFFQNDQMQATFGGGEANVAVSLANFGLDSAYVTKLPKHAIGQAAVDSLRYFGVDTTKIVRGGLTSLLADGYQLTAQRGGDAREVEPISALKDAVPIKILRLCLSYCGMRTVVDTNRSTLRSTLLKIINTNSVTTAYYL